MSKINLTSPDDSSIKSEMRKRHGLPEDTAVEVKALAMDAEMIDDYTFRARITTDSKDRDCEVVLPRGIDAKEFEKTGAVFWNHNYDMPLASHVKLIRGDGYIDAIAKFAKRPDGYVDEFFPDFARAMVSQGVVKGVSIGFMGVESRDPSRKDIEVYGDGLKRVWSKTRLLEWSLAPVQSNPDAMVMAMVSKGLLSPAVAKDVYGVESPANEPQPEQIDEPTVVKRMIPGVDIAPAEIEPTIIRRLLIGGKQTPTTDVTVKRLVIAEMAKRRGRIYL